MSETVEHTEEAMVKAEVPAEMLVVGAFAGALLGAAAAYFWARQHNAPKRLDRSQALKAGMLLLGTARQLAALLADEA